MAFKESFVIYKLFLEALILYRRVTCCLKQISKYIALQSINNNTEHYISTDN